jgi:hypothetical protein
VYKIVFGTTHRLKHTGFRTEKEVTIPEPPTHGIFVPDLVPFSISKTLNSGENFLPFGVAGVRFEPLVGPQLDLVKGESLQVVYQIWAAPGEPTSLQGKKFQIEYGFGRPGVAGNSKVIHDEVTREQFDANGSIVSGKKIPLADLNPGNYHLAVTVTDPESQQKAFS